MFPELQKEMKEWQSEKFLASTANIVASQSGMRYKKLQAVKTSWWKEL